MDKRNQTCLTCVCFPFCETQPDKCKHYINIVQAEIKKINKKMEK